MTNQHIYFCIGTTAEFIKLAPVIKELKKRKVSFKIITTGQNTIDFKELIPYVGKVKSDIAFSNKIHKSSILGFIIWMITTFIQAVVTLKTEFKSMQNTSTFFVVHGDTISSLLGALIAKIYRLRLVHIESGLRSFNFFEPFPEEITRFLVSKLADIHFCPNDWSVKNLQRYPGEKVNTYQNTLLESFLIARDLNLPMPKEVEGKKYCVLVIHRQEHVIFNKNYTRDLIRFILKNIDRSTYCVFIMHELTKKFLDDKYIENDLKERLIFVPRLPHGVFISLLQHAQYVITDGGSNQEELYYMGKPCLLLRNTTERIEGLGSNVVLSKNNKKIISDFCRTYKGYNKKPLQVKSYPSEIIVNYILKR